MTKQELVDGLGLSDEVKIDMNLNFRGNQLVPKILPKDVNQQISMDNDMGMLVPKIEQGDMGVGEAIKNEYDFYESLYEDKGIKAIQNKLLGNDREDSDYSDFGFFRVIFNL